MSKFLNNLDLNGNELRNVKLQNLATAPATSAYAGGIYYDTVSNTVQFHNGTAWVTVSVGASGTYQPADADLTAIAALTGTSGFLKSNGSGTWTIDTATYLTSGTGVTTVNGSSGAISNVALTTGTLAQFAATTSAQLAGVVSDETGTGALVFANTPTLVSPILGTPTSVTLTNATGLPVTTGISGLGTGVATFLATPSSANLASAVTDETGTGVLVFGTSPAITTSLTTGSTTFALVNTTATTVNFAGAATTVSIGAGSGTTTINNDAVVQGNLTVNGTTTTVNSTVVTVDDILIELGSVASPTNTTAEGGGLSLLGTTNKTITWGVANTAWTSSENFNIVTGKTYKINGTDVLSSTTLGSGITGSSLTSVGTITGGTWNASTIAVLYGGTGATTVAGAKTNLGFTTKYAADIGDGTATSVTVSHGLASSDVQVYVYEKASPYGQVFPDVAHTSSSVVTLSFAVAPTSAQYRVVVIG
jgi:hypothetical protein